MDGIGFPTEQMSSTDALIQVTASETARAPLQVKVPSAPPVERASISVPTKTTA